MNQTIKQLFFVMVVCSILLGCSKSTIFVVNTTIPVVDTKPVLLRNSPHPFIKGVKVRVNILANLFDEEDTYFIRIYTDEEETKVIKNKEKVGVYLSWYNDFHSPIFIPLSDKVLEEGVCPDQRLMAKTFLQTKPKFKERVALNQKNKKTFPIILRIWQNKGAAKKMFCRSGSNSRDFNVIKLSGVPRYKESVNMKVIFRGIDSSFDAPDGFSKVPSFFGDYWESKISFSSEDGEYSIEVDPRWLQNGYVIITPLEKYVVYPPRGINMETTFGEIASEWKKVGKCIINFVYPQN